MRDYAEVYSNGVVDVSIAKTALEMLEIDDKGLYILTGSTVVDDEKINALRQMTSNLVSEISEEMSIHDFRVVDGPTHTNLIFDLIVPHKYKLSNEEVCKEIENNLSKIDERYFAVITVEHSFN